MNIEERIQISFQFLRILFSHYPKAHWFFLPCHKITYSNLEVKREVTKKFFQVKDIFSNKSEEDNLLYKYLQSCYLNDLEVHVGLGTSKSYITGKRTKNTIEASVAFALDIDVKPSALEYKELTELQKILWFINESPSIIVDSGYGYHVYWVYKKASSVRVHEAIVNDFFDTLQNSLKELGIKLDSTKDVTHTYRLPGSLNLKNPDTEIVSTVVSNSGIYYDPEVLNKKWNAPEINTGVSKIQLTEIKKIDGNEFDILRNTSNRFDEVLNILESDDFKNDRNNPPGSRRYNLSELIAKATYSLFQIDCEKEFTAGVIFKLYSQFSNFSTSDITRKVELTVNKVFEFYKKVLSEEDVSSEEFKNLTKLDEEENKNLKVKQPIPERQIELLKKNNERDSVEDIKRHAIITNCYKEVGLNPPPFGTPCLESFRIQGEVWYIFSWSDKNPFTAQYEVYTVKLKSGDILKPTRVTEESFNQTGTAIIIKAKVNQWVLFMNKLMKIPTASLVHKGVIETTSEKVALSLYSYITQIGVSLANDDTFKEYRTFTNLNNGKIIEFRNNFYFLRDFYFKHLEQNSKNYFNYGDVTSALKTIGCVQEWVSWEVPDSNVRSLLLDRVYVTNLSSILKLKR